MKTHFDKSFWMTTLIFIIISIIIYFFMLLWMQDTSFIGHMDAMLMAFMAPFLSGTFIFISNSGALDILVYGVSKFGKAFIGKQPKESYLDYTLNKKKVPKNIILAIWFASLILFVPLVIMYLMYYLG